MFTQVNMKICGSQNVKEQREINNSEQYIAVYVSLKFGHMYKIKIIS